MDKDREIPNNQQDSEAVSSVESLPDDPEALKEALLEAGEKSQRYLANWQRSQADFINYKKRIDNEQGEFTKFANVKLVAAILPALDDLDRAMASMPAEVAALPWTEGLKLIQRKLQTVLENEGVSEIKALGETFDPAFHEAVSQTKGEDGKVVQELQKGYRMHGRVVRPSMVIVGNGE